MATTERTGSVAVMRGPLTRLLTSTPVLRLSCLPLDMWAELHLATARGLRWLAEQNEREK